MLCYSAKKIHFIEVILILLKLTCLVDLCLVWWSFPAILTSVYWLPVW